MGGRGSGGRRTGSGRKKLTDLERAIGGNAGKRGVVLQHPNSTANSTAIAPVKTFDAPPELQGNADDLATLTAELAFLQQATGPGDPNPQIAELQSRLAEQTVRAQALAVWHELAPQAFAERTLTPATAAAFVMLCRAVVGERTLSASPSSAFGANHRGLMHRVATWMKDFAIAPLGKPLYAAQPEAPANPLDRFTKTRA
jgi:hypothetical protein